MSDGSCYEKRVLGIYPSIRGFGYAVFEGYPYLIDFGISEIPVPTKRQKNANTREISTMPQPGWGENFLSIYVVILKVQFIVFFKMVYPAGNCSAFFSLHYISIGIRQINTL